MFGQVHVAARFCLSLTLAFFVCGQSSAAKRVVFVAGRPSHGFGAHEHYAGCKLLADALNASNLGIEAVVYRNGWPEDPHAFDGADCIVMYADGGDGHYVNRRVEQVDALMDRGVGLVCIHYAVEVPKGKVGNHFLKWLGGCFETYWSVNPHWDADFKTLPDHPITRGVSPFKINDEWYYHMRFRPEMQGVTPILTAVPPEQTRTRAFGTQRGGNPDVVKRRGMAEHVAWAAERPNGGRGFGFTGGHVHWNWGDDNFRKIVLNAIAWAAHVEVPPTGVHSKPLTREDLEKNQDEPNPRKLAEVRRQLQTHSKPLFQSETLSKQTPVVKIDVDITRAKDLYLVVTDGGNGYSCDWADWMEPRLVGPNGEKKLTELNWKAASSDWGQVRIDRNANGGPLRVAGELVPFGIGTHANSIIHFELPADHTYTRFQANGGLDNGGTDQGNAASVQFFVFTQAPPKSLTDTSGESRNPQEAVANLDVHPELDATLFAAEPMVLSPTNIDIDHRGRIWVCEVVNYRGRNGTRPEGDRILILEDTNEDGVADKSTVFYQGRDIDTALGICVLGNKVIVSVAPDVFIFTDEDGDDKADKKESLFTKVGQPQHDHSVHAFVFGPDGKLYFNFGNTGMHVHDAKGQIIVDKAGHPVIDNGKPYIGGMLFRCNLDGSQFEVLGHNFRNNYEVSVDSFGNLWQSDNDDDGNRGVRINYVMEYGNYGYKDEITGAGWREPRTNLEKEIPLQHWHLNDPGVVPNLLQTGAGSPTGICVYEGRMLPKVFWDQMIHCDAGPNVVRAYPVQKDGAGYRASVENILQGSRDQWFRPSDVCVAPDGSIFVADWYDPGVGGHRMGDIDKGRIFRVALPNQPYKVPKYDFNTVAGAIEALKSPNHEARYLAWTALHQMGEKAEPELQQVFERDANPRFRARALWLLGNLPGRTETYVQQAIGDKDPDLRIVGLRLARQKELPIPSIVEKLARDPSVQVRRECAIALRHESEQTASLWATLASQHDGKDRWYLEALGIAADGKWDAFLNAWLQTQSDALTTAAGRDIIWRSRAKRTPELLARIVTDPSAPLETLPRYMRAFDFQSPEYRQPVLTSLAFELPEAVPVPNRTFIATEALDRLAGFDVSEKPHYRATLNSLLNAFKGTNRFVELVGKFNVKDRYGDLLAIAQQHASTDLGVQAVRLLLDRDQLALLENALAASDVTVAVATATALGSAADGRIVQLLRPLILKESVARELRDQAVRSVARTRNGARLLLELAEQNRLDPGLKLVAAAALNAAAWDDVRQQAATLLPVPDSGRKTPFPAIATLLKGQGNAQNGKIVFETKGTCINCHRVHGKGKEVGPELSEIGNKLSRQAMFESVLFPSAGISHNYESHILALEDGNVVTGIIISETAEQLVLRMADGLTRTFKIDEIAGRKKSEVSLMPTDVAKELSDQDLIDLVDYMMTLKRAQ